MRALAEALRFLSVLPLPGRPPKRPAAAVAAYPWAGLVLGLLAAAAGLAASLVFNPLGTAVMIVTARILLTGGLHMDGLADLADGLGGGRDREKSLAIMSDSRLGSFGALALLLMFSLQVTVIAGLAGPETAAPGGRAAPLFSPLAALLPGLPGRLTLLFPVVLAPVLSRGMLPLLMRIFPPARPGGMGDRARKAAAPGAAAASIASVLLLSAVFYGIGGPAAAVLMAVPVLLTASAVTRRLGGLTGDVYGALIEIGDLDALFLFLLGRQAGFLP